MHLGLIDGPFVPHNLISTQESPVPLPKFQTAPRLKILMASGSKTGTQTYFSFFFKIPANEPPAGSPTRPLWKGSSAYRAFCISPQNLIFGVPSKGAHPQSPLHGIPRREMSHHYSPPSFVCQSPRYTSPSPHTRFPSDVKGPPWREMPVSGDFLNISSRVPSEEATSRCPLHGAS